MEVSERSRLSVDMDAVAKTTWFLGWNPAPTYVLFACTAALGWLLVRHPVGMTLALLALLPRWQGIRLINNNWEKYLSQAESLVKERGATRLGVHLDDAQCSVLSLGIGKAPLGANPTPDYEISVVYICDVFFAVYQRALFSLPGLNVRLPVHGEEIYFRHVSVINYNPPNIEVILSNGKTTRQFRVGSERGGNVIETLRAKLRGTIPAGPPVAGSDVSKSSAVLTLLGQGTSPPANSADADSNEPRYCYLRPSKLRQLLGDESVLNALVEQLEVPGEPAVLKRLTAQEKMQCIETQIDHFRRSLNSVWYGIPTLEVLAASIWRAPLDREQRVLTMKMVHRGWFCKVSDEDDLRIPVAKWLKLRGYEPYMEIPLGLGRADVLGFKKPGLTTSARLTAVELKNDYEQFKRALNQVTTFAEYANLVYVACTPDFAADFLDRNEQAVKHWDPSVFERKLTAGGFGLLIVERDQVFEVIKPIERTPSAANFSKVVGNLSVVTLIEC